ncbi:MAG: hypothetical protein ACYDC5_07110 [Candidatus Dormibacteria bacterium]
MNPRRAPRVTRGLPISISHHSIALHITEGPSRSRGGNAGAGEKFARLDVVRNYPDVVRLRKWIR